jgi:hypothetical protein
MSDGVNEILLRIKSTGGKKAAAEVRELGSAGKEAQEESASVGSKFTSFMGKASNAAMFATIGAAALVVDHAVKDYAKLEVAQAGLHTSLVDNHVAHANKVQGSIEQMGRASKNTGGFGIQEELEAMTHFVMTSGSVTKARKETNDAVNLARLMHVELSDAIKITTAGEVAALKPVQKQLGIMEEVVTWKKKEKEAEKAGNYQKAAGFKALDQKLTGEAILLKVEQKANGARGQFATTLTGKYDKLKLSVTEFYDTLGKKLKPALISVFTFVAGHVGVFKTLAVAIAGVVAVLDAYWIVMKVIKAVEIVAMVVKLAWTAATWLQATATDALAVGLATATIAAFAFDVATGGVVLAIGLAVTALVLIITHFKQFKAVVMDVWTWIKGHWVLLAEIITAPVTGPLVLIIAHFKLIRTTVEDVFGGVATFVSKVFGSVVNGIIKAINFVVRAIDFVISAYDKIPSAFRPTGKIGQIGTIGELGDKPHAAALGGFRKPPPGEPYSILSHRPALTSEGVTGLPSGSLAGALALQLPINLDGKKIGESRHVVAGVEARQRAKHNTK